jgi:tRNA threonylcarbamoyladenosine biosynthesis protein TsaB
LHNWVHNLIFLDRLRKLQLANILAIDTSTAWCSVALSLDGQPLMHKHEQVSAGASQLVLPWIDEMLASAQAQLRDLDGIAVGIGPGAFTGVRLAVAVAQGLATASDLPIIPVVTLDAIAAQLASSDQLMSNHVKRFAIAVDARMDEIYWAHYETPNATDCLPQRVGQIHLSKPEGLDLTNIQFLAGNALSAYDSRLFSISSEFLPESSLDREIQLNSMGILKCAQQMLIDGRQCHVSELEPLYVRDKVAFTTSERQELFKDE